MSENQSSNNQQQSNYDQQLQKALETLHTYIMNLAEKAGESQEYGEALWNRISRSAGVLKELAYYHDYGQFWCKYQVAGYTIADILVWQVDHFKAYLDRPMAMNRYKQEKLLLSALDIMLQMEKDPAPFVAKMEGETGTDFVEKY